MPMPPSLLTRSVPLLLLAALGASAGCGHTLNVPRPPAGTPAHPPPLPTSRIEAPLSAELGDTLQSLESEVPRTFDTGGQFRMIGVTPVGIRYTVQRAPFRFTAEGSHIVAETTLEIAAEACVGTPGGLPIPLLGGICQPVASCGINEARRRVVIRTETALALSPDWRVVSETRPGAVRFLDRCELTAFRVDVSGIASQFVMEQVATATRQMDSRIAARGDLRPRAEQFWAALQTPIDLGEGFWLQLAPESVFAAPFTVTTARVETRVGIVARPQVTAGAVRPSVPRPLPPLEPAPPPGAGGQGDGGFRMTFDAAVDFAEVTRLVASEFQGRTLRLSGHDVLVRGVRTRGSGQALLIEMDVTFTDPPFGNTTGTVYLAGLPAYDAASGNLVVRELDYTLDTRSALLRMGEWFLRGSLREDVARRAVFPMRARIDRLRAQAQAALSRELVPGTRLRGEITGVRPQEAYVTEEGVVLRVAVEGTASVTQDLSTLNLVR